MSEIMTVDRIEITTVDHTTELWDGDEAAFFPLLPVTAGG